MTRKVNPRMLLSTRRVNLDGKLSTRKVDMEERQIGRRVNPRDKLSTTKAHVDLPLSTRKVRPYFDTTGSQYPDRPVKFFQVKYDEDLKEDFPLAFEALALQKASAAKPAAGERPAAP